MLTVLEEWNQMMRPRMWRDFTTRLRGGLAEDLDTLNHEQKACFYHVRTLNVVGRETNPDYATSVSRFIHLLRDDQLLEFNGDPGTPLNAMQLQVLLRRQTNLKCFRARLDLSTVPMDDATSWISSLNLLSLRSLLTLRIYVGDGYIAGDYDRILQKHETAYNHVLLEAASHIRCLEICGWRWEGLPEGQRIPLKGLFTHPAQNLKAPLHLIIANLDLWGMENRLITTIQLDILSSLKLEYCDRLGPFLHALAAALRRKTKAPLKILTVRNSRYWKGGENNGILDAVDDLLCSFEGLKELECSFELAKYVDWMSSLSRHGGLKKLHITCPCMQDGCPGWDEFIANILARCPNVHYFAYRPYMSTYGFIMECELPSELHCSLHETLNVVATAPSFRTLRLCYAPGLGENISNRHDAAWLKRVAQISHRFGTLVLIHLYSQGSAIRRLALSPESRWKQVRGDNNFHLYPHYFYELNIDYYNGHGVVNAVPLRDYVAECLDLAIFR
jgi:hypothetical protein